MAADERLLEVEERLLPADEVVRRELLAPPPFELVRLVFVFDEAFDLDVPFLLVDLPALDPVRLERVLEELVVCAILIASLLASIASCAYRAGGSFRLPEEVRI